VQVVVNFTTIRSQPRLPLTYFGKPVHIQIVYSISEFRFKTLVKIMTCSLDLQNEMESTSSCHSLAVTFWLKHCWFFKLLKSCNTVQLNFIIKWCQYEGKWSWYLFVVIIYRHTWIFEERVQKDGVLEMSCWTVQEDPLVCYRCFYWLIIVVSRCGYCFIELYRRILQFVTDLLMGLFLPTSNFNSHPNN